MDGARWRIRSTTATGDVPASSGEPFDVHHEKCDVSEHVRGPIRVVEREAIEDAWAIVQHEDFTGGQVAMAVAYESG